MRIRTDYLNKEWDKNGRKNCPKCNGVISFRKLNEKESMLHCNNCGCVVKKVTVGKNNKLNKQKELNCLHSFIDNDNNNYGTEVCRFCGFKQHK
jgi:hypothetical protein